MNRKLLRETYHVEIDEINFTHGLPTWFTEISSGGTVSSTHDYTHPYGSHYAAMLQGVTGEGVVLSGSPLRTGVVKVFEMEVLGMTVSSSTRLSLGLESLPSGTDRIVLETVPANAGSVSAGCAQLQVQAGNGGEAVTLFDEGSETVIDDLDLGIVIDCEQKRVEAHVGYSWVGMDADKFPMDQVLHPVLAGRLL
ncbi:MAG: hypothetical protein O2954_19200, partial [bacterium]|nr:hypothetical protein [bacterium]